MHDELEILDVEEKATNFVVVFEVPGEPYGQSYPERLRHSFPLRDSWFEDVEYGGEVMPRYEEYLIRQYLDRGVGSESARKKLGDVRERSKGKTLRPGEN